MTTDPARYAELAKILEGALDLPTSRRYAFVVDATDDSELALEAEKLLREEGALEGRFEPIWSEDTAGARSEAGEEMIVSRSKSGERLGPFTLLEELGSGGMGTVYLAEQEEPIHRRVALKIVDRPILKGQTRRRFEAEREALARLSHANIAALYEAGTAEDGTAFFAMELVGGEPITIYCDGARLGLRKRLLLFRSVCLGVAHAHQKGVLHRDLKPSNILVAVSDGRIEPKIIDFGIAKALDRPLIEQTLDTGPHLLGTPAFMSPEAVESNRPVDMRSDIYALGVLLYELVAGVRPLGREDVNPVRLMQRILKEDPSSLIERWQELSPEEQEETAVRRGETPGSLPRLLRGDLESVALRAVARRPDDRYESAQELVADIERCLDHLPVRTQSQKTDQTPSEIMAQAQIYRQLALYDQARHQLEAVRNRLNRIPSDLPALAPVYRELARVALHQDSLDEARTYLDRAWDFGREIEDDNERIAFQASVLDHSGQLFRRAEDFAAAEEDHHEAIRLLQSAPEPDFLELITAHSNLGTVYFVQERWQEAEARFRTTLDLCREHLPEHHAVTARALINLSASLGPQGQAAEAQPLIQEALESQRQTLRGDRSTVTRLLDNLGTITSDLDDSDRAELAFLAGTTVGWRL